MNLKSICAGLLVLGPACLGAADSPPKSGAAPDGKAAFTQLKALAGTWEGTLDGKTTRVTYEIASGGNALIERLMPGTPAEMVTIYYLAAGTLQATHYCAIGNQPAFTLASEKDGTYTFIFAGGTGFDPAKDAHVHDGYLKLTAPDRLESKWTYYENGKEAGANRWVLQKQ